MSKLKIICDNFEENDKNLNCSIIVISNFTIDVNITLNDDIQPYMSMFHGSLNLLKKNILNSTNFEIRITLVNSSLEIYPLIFGMSYLI